MKTPCKKDCPDRKAGCHNKDCPHGWYEWNQEHIEQRDALYKHNNLINRQVKHKYDNIRRR